VGSPTPAADAANVYVARRGGNATKSGAIIVLNNHDSQTKGLWVTTIFRLVELGQPLAQKCS